MKVLFAVSNEEISESIVKKYQKEYKQIISYKNVYYFNAILKELQKDKTYDRIVISEDLEAFTHTQYDQIDKFIFEKLDSISDEASNIKGSDIPIILICSDRRSKAEQILVKLFGIGVYNAIIGNDRSVDEVCRLINRPRAKKEAKSYYQIDSEDVSYQAENENDVSEMEIQNIVAHYKRLGKNEERYIESFNNIAAQYNDTQLRIISKFLPLNVRAVLEEKSQKYQQVMSFNNSVSNNLRYSKQEEKEGPSETLLKPKNRETIMSKPVVIPSAVNMSGSKKLSKAKPVVMEAPVMQPQPINNYEEEDDDGFADFEPVPTMPVQQAPNYATPVVNQARVSEPIIEGFDDFEEIEEPEEVINEVATPVKRGRGRPRKTPVSDVSEEDQKPKRGRGRPKKAATVEETLSYEEPETTPIMPGFDEVEEEEETFLPGVNPSTAYQNNAIDETTVLPGFDEEEEEKAEAEVEETPMMPGFDPQDPMSNLMYAPYQNNGPMEPKQEMNPNPYEPIQPVAPAAPVREDRYESNVDLSQLMSPDKKIVTFVGTSKNGTSFMVNNIAELMSSVGINTAILDTTKNRNSYYIYTKNEEPLRNIAANSIEGLAQGMTRGIQVNKNLTVYTSLPDETESIYQVDTILESLIKNHSLILIDTDFETPVGYFKQAQETYLIQTLDVLTIQPLTAFLRELKAKNILEEKKLRVILNKVVKIRGITDKTIIGGMAYYNDPSMSFMTELFDRNLMKYVSIPFEEETYIRYLENIIECNISLKGYSKIFMQTLKELGNMIYPLVNSKNQASYQPPSMGNNGGGNNFSPNMNHTLDQMKKNF